VGTQSDPVIGEHSTAKDITPTAIQTYKNEFLLELSMNICLMLQTE
jgi:hypothetical protein